MSNDTSAPLRLAFGFSFEDLYSQQGLARLDEQFLGWLNTSDAALRGRLDAVRANPASLAEKERSALLLALAPTLESFVGELFGISGEIKSLAARHTELLPLFEAKRNFVQRKAINKIKAEEAAGFDIAAIQAPLEVALGGPLSEMLFATKVEAWLKEEAAHAEQLGLAAKYAAWAYHTPTGKARHKSGVVFKAPHKLDPEHLVHIETVDHSGAPAYRMPTHEWRHREGFALTDHGMDLEKAADQAFYCIKCHNQGKDSCSTGLREKTGEFKKSVFGVTLNGCPLSERISEMNVLKEEGVPLGALAIVTVDNPMAAGTGHRICNDCMKSCVFQKQEPVDIPQIETRTLKDVLELPWGFEIYSLLTRWNPLNFTRPVPKADTGYKVLVVGLGPAGFTLSHHLMRSEEHTSELQSH